MTEKCLNIDRLSPAEVLNAFDVRFLDKEFCRRFVIGRLNPDGPRCPRCKEPITREKPLQRFWENGRVVCPACGKWFQALSGTPFSRVHMACRDIVLIALFLALGADCRMIGRMIGRHPETVRLWRKRYEETE